MRLRTAANVDATPSRRTLFHTSRTRSGRILAFCSRFFRANSAEARSVPTETKDAAVRTNTQPASNFGAGTSTTSISPPLTCWRSCFISCRKNIAEPCSHSKPTAYAIVRWSSARSYGLVVGQFEIHPSRLDEHFVCNLGQRAVLVSDGEILYSRMV